MLLRPSPFGEKNEVRGPVGVQQLLFRLYRQAVEKRLFRVILNEVKDLK